jgi:hypothetical protein
MGSGSGDTGFSDLTNLFFTRTAERDLDRLLGRNSREFHQVSEDLRRLALGTLPPGGRKKLHGRGLWQLDCGRLRVVCRPAGPSVYVIAVFSKPEQKKRLRRL